MTIRSLPKVGPTSHVAATLATKGTKVTISCFVTGQAIHHDAIWYRTVTPAAGYVAGYNLASGHDPAGGVPHC